MTIDVARLYEMFPFPSPEIDTPLVDVIANQMPFLLGENPLDGWRILDAGCGTGHTLVALALRYPKAYFVGLDACQRSLDIARRLAEHHGADNVELVQGGIPDLDLPTKFDFITCYGVLPIMSDPRAGLRWLSERLADEGLLHLWLYHTLGEHGRMLDRELALLFTSIDEGKSALEMVRALRITLPQTQYGLPVDQIEPELSAAEQDVFDADAYLNPIVQTMRFTDVPELFKGLDIEWVAADRIYSDGTAKFVDLSDTENNSDLFVGTEELFSDIRLRQRISSFDNLSRMRAIELRLRPTAFRLLAGRGDSLQHCAPRIRHNLLLSDKSPSTES
ncbi:MAG: class I SAM-dependent methyltransferase [Pseudonocardiaceae bacterium]